MLYIAYPLAAAKTYTYCPQVAAYLRKEAIPDGDGDTSHQTVITEIFNEEDKDNDGYISLSEFQGFKHEEL
jgi:hypothetical protein